LKDAEMLDKLFTAAENGDATLIKQLLMFGNNQRNIGKGDEQDLGRTCVHKAARGGHNEAIKVLVGELEADVNPVAKNGQTPMHSAAFNNRAETIRLLHSLGAPIDPKDEQDHQPIHEAARQGHAECIRCVFLCPLPFKRLAAF
jgi:ankyrin repeat protein